MVGRTFNSKNGTQQLNQEDDWQIQRPRRRYPAMRHRGTVQGNQGFNSIEQDQRNAVQTRPGPVNAQCQNKKKEAAPEVLTTSE